jgi:hypothetical protein
MKDFFKQELKDLYLKTGNRQMHWLAQECKDQIEYDIKVDKLAELMVYASERYKIPEEQKKLIISQQIIADPEFESLNARAVHKWLSKHEGVYIKPQEIEAEPIIQHDEETQKRIDSLLNEHLKTLAKGFTQRPLIGIAEEMAKIRNEDKERLEGKRSVRKGYTPPTAEQIAAKELHTQWIRENFHPITREKLPSYLDEQEWLVSQENRT